MPSSLEYCIAGVGFFPIQCTQLELSRDVDSLRQVEFSRLRYPGTLDERYATPTLGLGPGQFALPFRSVNLAPAKRNATCASLSKAPILERPARKHYEVPQKPHTTG